jgi:hypothetical protein
MRENASTTRKLSAVGRPTSRRQLLVPRVARRESGRRAGRAPVRPFAIRHSLNSSFAIRRLCRRGIKSAAGMVQSAAHRRLRCMNATVSRNSPGGGCPAIPKPRFRAYAWFLQGGQGPCAAYHCSPSYQSRRQSEAARGSLLMWFRHPRCAPARRLSLTRTRRKSTPPPCLGPSFPPSTNRGNRDVSPAAPRQRMARARTRIMGRNTHAIPRNGGRRRHARTTR